MDHFKFRLLSPYDQIEILKNIGAYGNMHSDNLKKACRINEFLKNKLNIIRRCLAAEVILLRAKKEIIAVYKGFSFTEREFLQITPKIIRDYKKLASLIEKRIENLQNLRIEKRAALKEQNMELQDCIDDCKSYVEKTWFYQETGESFPIIYE